jgi:hypothetical protein
LEKEHRAIASHNSAGNPPLGGAIFEEHGANELNQHQGYQEIGHARSGTWHQGPSALELAEFLVLFVLTSRDVLELAESHADEATDDKSCNGSEHVYKLICHNFSDVWFFSKLRERVALAQLFLYEHYALSIGVSDSLSIWTPA